ncbi:unnamed protein product, partial [marine sediment metagenome]
LCVEPDTNIEYIEFNNESMNKCSNCLKCFKDCPNNAIIPNISTEGI